MPDVTPAEIVWTGGALRLSNYRVAGAVALWGGGSVSTSNESEMDIAMAVPRLDRLTRFDRLTEGEGVSTRFQVIWQETMEAIEAAFAALNRRVDDNTRVLARLLAVEAKAEVANDNAISAQQTTVALTAATQSAVATIDPALVEYFDNISPYQIVP